MDAERKELQISNTAGVLENKTPFHPGKGRFG